ncbi:hypothetical protein BDEG_20596 [Batrachochytrium dendrobatidis JEL423]|uniref:Uncharacterized protein n=1 Tax=Batrachochytrium dendrobatidis (strain JEL423) TaxID=403673 RepID=A0A177WAK6_BATDL|nr:hypothetical protein BDEG_20596 [Batrachochytrium dendrobatidis JEL423]
MAEWESKDKNRCLIYWRTPEEWASQVYTWVFNTGRTGTVCTTYEVFCGDETEGECKLYYISNINPWLLTICKNSFNPIS